MDDFGQVSAEMVVLLAAVLGIAYFVITSLHGTAKEMKSNLEGTNDKISDKMKDIKKLV